MHSFLLLEQNYKKMMIDKKADIEPVKIKSFPIAILFWHNKK